MNTMEYKGYFGTVEYSAADHCLYGRLAYIRDLVNYEATTVEELKNQFHVAVDDYLASCEARGKQPNRPFKGSFNVRTGPELHKAAVMASGAKSLNAFVCEAIRTSISATAINEKQRDFLVSELWILSWNASVQRVNLYNKNTSETKKKDFRNRVKDFRNRVIDWISQELLEQYSSEMGSGKHEENLEKLIQKGSEFGKDILKDGKYPLGVAQKLLNLQLKYLWCYNITAKPPHCPVDSIIMKELPSEDRKPWTKIEELSAYKNIISKLKAIAGDQSLADWELTVFLRRNNSQSNATSV